MTVDRSPNIRPRGLAVVEETLPDAPRPNAHPTPKSDPRGSGRVSQGGPHRDSADQPESLGTKDLTVAA